MSTDYQIMESFTRSEDRYLIMTKSQASPSRGYINSLEVTTANANSIFGVITKNDWFKTFYSTWKTIQANNQLNNRLTEIKVNELNEAIENVKSQLDEEGIVY